MLRAIAMALGLSLVWLVMVQPQNTLWNWLAMGAAVLACSALAWRFGGFPDAYVRAPSVLFAHAQRSIDVMRGVVSIVRTASGGPFSRSPTLVRVRAQNGKARASFATLLNATPGLTIVDADEGGLLIHVFDEAAGDSAALTRAAQSLGAAQ